MRLLAFIVLLVHSNPARCRPTDQPSRALLQVGAPKPPYPKPTEWKSLVTVYQSTGLVTGGKLLIKDALSLSKVTKSMKECGAACKRLQGCNAWSFCDNKSGCSVGCAAYAKKYKKLSADPGGVGKPYWALKLPVNSVGYWTYPKPGGSGCQGNKYAYGTCSLFSIPNTKSPPITRRTAGVAGFISGVLTRHPFCQSTLSTTCSACGLSPNPDACLACAKKFPVSTEPIKAMLASTAHDAALGQAACLKCSGFKPGSMSVKQCFDCVLNKKPCATCAYTKYEPGKPKPSEPNLASCLSCSYTDLPSKYPPYKPTPTLTQACRSCLTRPAPQAAICLPWLANFNSAICKETWSNYSNCIWPETIDYAIDTCLGKPDCAACASSPQTCGSTSPTYSQTAKCLLSGDIVPCLDCVRRGRKYCAESVGTCWGCGEDISGTSYTFDPATNDCYNDPAVRAPEVCPDCTMRDFDMGAPSHLAVDTEGCIACLKNSSTVDFWDCVQYP